MLHQKLICSTAGCMIRNGLEVSRNKAMHVYWMQLPTLSLCFIKAKMRGLHSNHKCLFVILRFFCVFHIVFLSFCFCLGSAIASPLLPPVTGADEGKLFVFQYRSDNCHQDSSQGNSSYKYPGFIHFVCASFSFLIIAVHSIPLRIVHNDARRNVVNRAKNWPCEL